MQAVESSIYINSFFKYLNLEHVGFLKAQGLVHSIFTSIGFACGMCASTGAFVNYKLNKLTIFNEVILYNLNPIQMNFR